VGSILGDKASRVLQERQQNAEMFEQKRNYLRKRKRQAAMQAGFAALDPAMKSLEGYE
jgi:hypothetical protein